MNRFLIVILLVFGLSSCKSKKKVVTKKNKSSKTVKATKTNSSSSTINYSAAAKKVVSNAKQFDGVRYKYGGTTKKGMDCSGLVYTSFKQENISLPRTTTDLSKTGDWVDVKEVQKGDLLFFGRKQTDTERERVTHVAIYLGNNEYIHAAGRVKINSLEKQSKIFNKYRLNTFIRAKRIIGSYNKGENLVKNNSFYK